CAKDSTGWQLLNLW
nr:immunoglobulin heavy chain junction region [Macaca mulatta]MOV53376.1 immunoglobulin heavy chain junction region [Macaca mulatta]MOV53593.1 immunoglobulin heavy chain junction region [Macaca mulatta]MOV54084.1 immunoglobulin heavy chain junction region [Macaca mulatta]MOV54924.1 immunoglobulin heavy chain junction region [Macaca mulatta]